MFYLVSVAGFLCLALLLKGVSEWFGFYCPIAEITILKITILPVSCSRHPADTQVSMHYDQTEGIFQNESI